MILTSCIRVFYLSSEMPSDKTKMNTLKIISRVPFSKISRAVRKSTKIFSQTSYSESTQSLSGKIKR